MLKQHDVDYFLKREVEERERALSSPDPSAKSVHLQLAERYADVAWSAEEALDRPIRASGLWPQHDVVTTVLNVPR